MNFLSIAALFALALVSSVGAQVTIQDSNSDITSQTLPLPLSSQQTHLMALEDMTAASNSTLEKSLAREKRMRAFIENNDLGQAFDAYPTTGSHDMAMSFSEALHQAIVNARAGGPTGDGGSGNVSGEISAYEKLAHSSWDRLQASMTAVHRMSAFLSSRNQLQGYMQWAGDQSTQAHKKLLEDGEAAAKAARERKAHLQRLVQDQHAVWVKAMAQERQDRLKWNWDIYKFNGNRGLTQTQLNGTNSPYSGFRNYSDGYQDDGGWALSSTGHFHPSVHNHLTP